MSRKLAPLEMDSHRQYTPARQLETGMRLWWRCRERRRRRLNSVPLEADPKKESLANPNPR